MTTTTTFWRSKYLKRNFFSDFISLWFSLTHLSISETKASLSISYFSDQKNNKTNPWIEIQPSVVASFFICWWNQTQLMLKLVSGEVSVWLSWKRFDRFSSCHLFIGGGGEVCSTQILPPPPRALGFKVWRERRWRFLSDMTYNKNKNNLVFTFHGESLKLFPDVFRNSSHLTYPNE